MLFMREPISERRRKLRESIIVMVLVLIVLSSFKLLHWGSQDQSWYQVILVGPVAAAIYWALTNSLRKFTEDDVTAKPQA